MIINIPITVDDSVFEEKFTQDMETQVIAKIVKDVETALIERAGYYYTQNRAERVEQGLRNMVSNAIDTKIEEYKNEIIDAASERLAERLCRTKRAKEILEGLSNE